MNVHIGSWAIPAAITLISIGSVFAPSQPPRGYDDIGTGIMGMFHLLLALIVSLLAWLIWALVA